MLTNFVSLRQTCSEDKKKEGFNRKVCLQRLVLLCRGTEKVGGMRACKMCLMWWDLGFLWVFHAMWGSPTFCVLHIGRTTDVTKRLTHWAVDLAVDSVHRSFARHRECLTESGEETPVTFLLCALLALKLQWPVTEQQLRSVTDVLYLISCPKPGGTCTVSCNLAAELEEKIHSLEGQTMTLADIRNYEELAINKRKKQTKNQTEKQAGNTTLCIKVILEVRWQKQHPTQWRKW